MKQRVWALANRQSEVSLAATQMRPRAENAWRGKDRPTATLRVKTTKAYIAAMTQPIVSCSPDVMGGTAVFFGTRVPVQTLLDYIEAGESIDDFLGGFPSIKREQVIAFLEEARDRVVEAAS